MRFIEGLSILGVLFMRCSTIFAQSSLSAASSAASSSAVIATSASSNASTPISTASSNPSSASPPFTNSTITNSTLYQDDPSPLEEAENEEDFMQENVIIPYNVTAEIALLTCRADFPDASGVEIVVENCTVVCYNGTNIVGDQEMNIEGLVTIADSGICSDDDLAICSGGMCCLEDGSGSCTDIDGNFVQ